MVKNGFRIWWQLNVRFKISSSRATWKESTWFCIWLLHLHAPNLISLLFQSLNNAILVKECPNHLKFSHQRFLSPWIAQKKYLAIIRKFFPKAYQFGKKKFSILEKSSRRFVRLDERITNMLLFFLSDLPFARNLVDRRTDRQTWPT